MKVLNITDKLYFELFTLQNNLIKEQNRKITQTNLIEILLLGYTENEHTKTLSKAKESNDALTKLKALEPDDNEMI